ncbi:MAG: hypothetical protein AAGH57_15285 [Pseudomonadota bacterium]
MPATFAFAAPLALALTAAAPADQASLSTAIPAAPTALSAATTSAATTPATASAAGSAIVFTMAAALPEEPITPQEAFASLEGRWEGTLAYRDYGTKRLESIPVAVTMETQPDGETMVQRFDYTDPGYQVYVTNLITVKDGLLAGATARAGRAFETYEKDVVVTAQAMPQRWTLVLSDEFKDDGRPARMRETMRRAEGTLTILKEVDYLDDDKEEWVFRNEITLLAAD